MDSLHVTPMSEETEDHDCTENWVPVHRDLWWQTHYSACRWDYPVPRCPHSRGASASRLMRLLKQRTHGVCASQRQPPLVVNQAFRVHSQVSSTSFSASSSSVFTDSSSSTPQTTPSSSLPKAVRPCSSLRPTSLLSSCPPTDPTVRQYQWDAFLHPSRGTYAKPPHYHASLLRSSLPCRKSKAKSIPRTVDFFREEMTRHGGFSQLRWPVEDVCETSHTSIAVQVAETTLCTYEVRSGFFGWDRLCRPEDVFGTKCALRSREEARVLGIPISEEEVEKGRMQWSKMTREIVGRVRVPCPETDGAVAPYPPDGECQTPRGSDQVYVDTLNQVGESKDTLSMTKNSVWGRHQDSTATLDGFDQIPSYSSVVTGSSATPISMPQSKQSQGVLSEPGVYEVTFPRLEGRNDGEYIFLSQLPSVYTPSYLFISIFHHTLFGDVLISVLQGTRDASISLCNPKAQSNVDLNGASTHLDAFQHNEMTPPGDSRMGAANHRYFPWRLKSNKNTSTGWNERGTQEAKLSKPTGTSHGAWASSFFRPTPVFPAPNSGSYVLSGVHPSSASSSGPQIPLGANAERHVYLGLEQTKSIGSRSGQAGMCFPSSGRNVSLSAPSSSRVADTRLRKDAQGFWQPITPPSSPRGMQGMLLRPN